jgi:hypothetical protein
VVASNACRRLDVAGWHDKPTSLINSWLTHNQFLRDAAHDAAQVGPRTLRRVVETAVHSDEPTPGPEALLLTWALRYVDYHRLAKVLGGD